MSTVLILGAASDMAVALAQTFAEKGHQLQLAARNADRLLPLASDLKIRFGTLCTIHEFEAVQFASHEQFYQSLPARPDIVVCVFGWLGDQEKAMADWAEAEQIIHANYTGAVSILNIAAVEMAARKQGVIVGISSVAGDRGRQSNYIYGSAKAGFSAYLSGLRNRMFASGVHVLTVKPGFVYTRMTENLALPPLLTAKPGEVAVAIEKAIRNRKNVLYVKWFWKWIMLIITLIPEFIFKKLKL